MSEGIYPVIIFILLAAVAIVTSVLTSFVMRIGFIMFKYIFVNKIDKEI